MHHKKLGYGDWKVDRATSTLAFLHEPGPFLIGPYSFQDRKIIAPETGCQMDIWTGLAVRFDTVVALLLDTGPHV